MNQNTAYEANWVYPEVDIEWQKKIVSEFHIHPVIAQVLDARKFKNIEEIHYFLYARLPDLFDPDKFSDMPKAVERVVSALDEGQNILIYGDTDVDGMTGTALLTEFLRGIGAKVYPYLPQRNSMKQKVMLDALDYALKKDCKLMITVDCGITSADAIDEFVKMHIDVIVTDHHEPTHRIPNTVATLNPKLIEGAYPNRDLTGVGVAFKLVHALSKHLVSKKNIERTFLNIESYLDLVMLGTIADMGSLRGENRILVRYGLSRLQKTKRIGLIELMKICDIKQDEVTTTDVSTKIAPRLNSAGRIDEPRKGVDLLLVHNEKDAVALAKELDLNNVQRQRIEKEVSDDIERILAADPSILENKAIVLASNEWHSGVIPILAARIAKQYNRPCVLIAQEERVCKGSLRTIQEFPLLPFLKQTGDLLLNYGGHDFAAGLTILNENIPSFIERFVKLANQHLEESDVIAKVSLDGFIDFKDLTFELMDSFQLFEPFGNENPTPIFYANVNQNWYPKVVGNQHLKMYLEQEDRVLEGIAFNMAQRRSQIAKKNIKLQIAFSPQINRFLNKSSLQLIIRDFKIIS
ncbi:MAG: Single-stranded-DNA-specific exonuclease RecJ [Chlamydiae bacterium]|nr:Single-stranded-DNA-specific exonuclease RecJ [Chlamydiota bacterium]